MLIIFYMVTCLVYSYTRLLVYSYADRQSYVFFLYKNRFSALRVPVMRHFLFIFAEKCSFWAKKASIGYMKNTSEQDFERLVRDNKDTIYTVCYMFSKDSDEVSDLFQDILVNLWQGFDKFRGESKERTWVWRVSFNTCISADRKKRKMPTTRLDMNIDLFDDDDTDSRQIQVLRQRIQRLQPLDRAIVLLWLESLSYQEIADIVGLTPKNISVRLTRIRLQLKQMKD